MIFSPDPANFSASDRPGVEFLKVWESLEKNKNLKLIKMAENGNRAKRKCHTSFFAFHILDFKIVPNYSELNFSTSKWNSFISKKRVWYPEKQPNLKKWFEIWKKTSFDSTKLKTGKWWELTWIYCYLLNGIGLDLELHNSNLVQKIPKWLCY